jgi:hypothetical protein
MSRVVEQFERAKRYLAGVVSRPVAHWPDNRTAGRIDGDYEVVTPSCANNRTLARALGGEPSWSSRNYPEVTRETGLLTF